MAEFKFSISVKTAEEIRRARGLEKGGAAQKCVDEAVIELCEPYVPYLTGALKSSPYRFSPPGGGKVVYGVEYAEKQYYENKGGEGLRGARWFERMKDDRGEEIIQRAAQAVGGRKES